MKKINFILMFTFVIVLGYGFEHFLGPDIKYNAGGYAMYPAPFFQTIDIQLDYTLKDLTKKKKISFDLENNFSLGLLFAIGYSSSDYILNFGYSFYPLFNFGDRVYFFISPLGLLINFNILRINSWYEFYSGQSGYYITGFPNIKIGFSTKFGISFYLDKNRKFLFAPLYSNFDFNFIIPVRDSQYINPTMYFMILYGVGASLKIKI